MYCTISNAPRDEQEQFLVERAYLVSVPAHFQGNLDTLEMLLLLGQDGNPAIEMGMYGFITPTFRTFEQ
jgi:hypothetical protein